MGMDSAPEAGTDDVEAERDHWRTLLEVTNAVVTKRDLAELRAAVAPNVRRIVRTITPICFWLTPQNALRLS